MKNNPDIVGIAQGGVVKSPGELITYALGSCVGICLYDRKNKIAGMAHILLPSRQDALDQTNLYKFADTGCERLLSAMLKEGADLRSITAKIAGGATMFGGNSGRESIGTRNVKAVRAALMQLGIGLTAEDTGKDYGRTVALDAASGAVTVRSVKYGVHII